MTVRNCGAATLAFGSPATKPRHLRRKAALIDEDHIGARLLAGMGSLFLYV